VIITKAGIEDVTSKELYDYIESNIEFGKCVEIYNADKSMVYVKKMDNLYAYGYYPKFAAAKNEEWSCQSYSFYPSNQTVEFETKTDYTETREFDLKNVVKIYIGDEWSN